MEMNSQRNQQTATAIPYHRLVRRDLFGKFNHPKRKKAYFKLERMRLELKNVQHSASVTPQQAWLQLRAMQEEDDIRTCSISQDGSVQALAKGEVCEGCELNPCKYWMQRKINLCG